MSKNKETQLERSRKDEMNKKVSDALRLRHGCQVEYMMSADPAVPYKVMKRGLDVTPRSYHIPGLTPSCGQLDRQWAEHTTRLLASLGGTLRDSPSTDLTEEEFQALSSDELAVEHLLQELGCLN